VDPVGGSSENPEGLSVLDEGSRTIQSLDPLGNATTFTYDAANRRLTVTDALGNATTYTYNNNSNVTKIAELEKDYISINDEIHVTMFEYDELNRRKRTRVRGKEVAGPTYNIDHSTYVWYDSTGYVRLTQDAEDRWSMSTRDDLGRTV